ncbi:uncharacterized protein LOC119559650 [Drosophila subpulchrella]|uniref:uncharacterized protein LOC119559650 n=1 Tax=Drosophila subpulchrella TaxID=1486046 RepID=UPI0018A127EA|nr:uncharacterized protein LOC119559650 [Drosophila subpulchrella]
MAAHQPSGGSSPGQGWSTARPTRTSRRISGRDVPEPVISSDSDVELVEDPRVEQRRWRLRRAVNRADGRIPTGAAEVEWTSEEPPQDQQAPAESVAAATLEYRRKGEINARALHPATRSGRRLGALTPAVAAQSPTHTAVRGITAEDASTTTHAEPPPQQQPEQRRQQQLEQQPQREQSQQQQPDPPQQQQGDPMGHHIRTDITAAHVSHSTRPFVAEGLRRRQQTVVWTWPEGPAEETATTEEPRIWEESGPRVPTDTEHRTSVANIC